MNSVTHNSWPAYLETARLRLVPVGKEGIEMYLNDQSALLEHLNLSSIKMEMPAEFRAEHPDSMRYVLSQIEKNPEHENWWSMWMVVEKTTNRWIGGFGCAGPPNAHGAIFMGYWIDERFHGKGYMTEAVQRFVRWLFTIPAVASVTANTPESNKASQKVLYKSGFLRRGEFEGHPMFVLDRERMAELNY